MFFFVSFMVRYSLVYGARAVLTRCCTYSGWLSIWLLIYQTASVISFRSGLHGYLIRLRPRISPPSVHLYMDSCSRLCCSARYIPSPSIPCKSRCFSEWTNWIRWSCLTYTRTNDTMIVWMGETNVERKSRWSFPRYDAPRVCVVCMSERVPIFTGLQAVK